VGDYLWYLFIFFGLIEAIAIARRKGKLDWEHTLQQRLEHDKLSLLNGIELDLMTFNIKVQDYYEVKGEKIKSDKIKSDLTDMKSYYNDSALKIKAIITSIDDDFEKLWNQEIYKNLKKKFASYKCDSYFLLVT